MTNYARYNESGQLLDETGKTLWEALNIGYDPQEKDTGDGNSATTTPVMRFRAPYSNIANYDMKGDAVQLVVETIMQKRLPYYVAYVMAVNMINMLKDDLNVRFEDFTEDGNNEVIIDGAGTWAKTIIEKVPNFCRQYLRGEIAIPDRTSAWYQVIVSCATIQGRRKTQEDRYVCLPSLSVHHPGIEPDVPLFAIFDGHNGSQIASYAAAHLPYEFGDALKQNTNVAMALTEAMRRLDIRAEKRSTVEPWRSVGSTAIVAAVTSTDIHIRWLGDSPAFIMSATDVKQLTVHHNGDTQPEIDRVMAAGGEFLWRDGDTRLQGVLSVSRSLGDVAMRPALSGEAEALTVTRNESQYLLILTCDGITDVFKPKDIFSHIVDYVKENDDQEYAELAEYIVSKAHQCGSTDNCTCVIVFLCDPKKVWETFDT